MKTYKGIIFMVVLGSVLMNVPLIALTDAIRSQGFVYLSEIDPTIQQSVRYCSDENFVATVVDGYAKPVIILTKQAAQALKEVQKEVNRDGYELVVYDAFRPQRAVNHFMRWSEDVKDQAKKSLYYPRVNKADVFALGYVAQRSGHSRGSTVDLTIIKRGHKVQPITEKKRTLRDGYTITMLDDGTVDMGSSFDLFDVASHFDNELIAQEYKHMRAYLKNVMEKHGFVCYEDEWWHFTLQNEPHPKNLDSSYFDFVVE